MRQIIRKAEPCHNLPLLHAAYERQFRALPYPAKRLALKLDCEPEVARLLVELAGLGGRHGQAVSDRKT